VTGVEGNEQGSAGASWRVSLLFLVLCGVLVFLGVAFLVMEAKQRQLTKRHKLTSKNIVAFDSRRSSTPRPLFSPESDIDGDTDGGGRRIEGLRESLRNDVNSALDTVMEHLTIMGGAAGLATSTDRGRRGTPIWLPSSPARPSPLDEAVRNGTAAYSYFPHAAERQERCQELGFSQLSPRSPKFDDDDCAVYDTAVGVLAKSTARSRGASGIAMVDRPHPSFEEIYQTASVWGATEKPAIYDQVSNDARHDVDSEQHDYDICSTFGLIDVPNKSTGLKASGGQRQCSIKFPGRHHGETETEVDFLPSMPISALQNGQDANTLGVGRTHRVALSAESEADYELPTYFRRRGGGGGRSNAAGDKSVLSSLEVLEGNTDDEYHLIGVDAEGYDYDDIVDDSIGQTAGSAIYELSTNRFQTDNVYDLSTHLKSAADDDGHDDVGETPEGDYRRIYELSSSTTTN
jgi:hypothetical protein